MKIYVTQGHERGIGLEVFLKSCVLLPADDLARIQLLVFQPTLIATLESLGLPFGFEEDHLLLGGTQIGCTWLTEKGYSESFSSLELGMKLCETGGVLYTLPTSKDQFPGFAGHTEYFRAFYHRPDLGMFFSSPGTQVLLLSDHIAISALSTQLTEPIIFERLYRSLETLKHWHWPTKRILVSGFNPHAGENGLIGTEDERIRLAINRLRTEKSFDVSGPFPGDTMFLEQRSPQDLLVYLFHDQGLGVFKGTQGFVGSNITLGLDYPRVSPDHGTSFSLFGQNRADYRGCAYSLREALWLAKRNVHGKNSSHQGPRPQP